MALFFRNNANVLSFINNFCTKFSTSVAPPNTTVNFKNRLEDMLLELRQQKKKVLARTEPSHVSFDRYVSNKRRQAERSILVEIKSINSMKALYDYCTSFGIITSMDHYHMNETHYVVIEFENSKSTKLLLNRASTKKKNSLYIRTSSVQYINESTDYASINSRLAHDLLLKEKTKMFYQMTVNDNYLTQELMKCNSVSDQINTLYKMTRLTDFEIRLRFLTAWQIEQCINHLFPNVIIHPFGSSVNGFGKKCCDLDLVLNFLDNNMSANNGGLVFQSKIPVSEERQCIAEQMNGLADLLKNFVPGVYDVKRILQARVPIIKFHHNYSKIECDLSMSNMIALHMTELLYLYGQIDYRVRPLVFTVRAWARVKNITNNIPGRWITNFSLSLLVIFYLQQKHILPTLNELRSCTPDIDKRSIDGHDCTFIRKLQDLHPQFSSTNTDSLQELLYDFFEYYSRFNFNAAISLRDGSLVSKNNASALYICNPLESTLNVTKNVTIHELERIKDNMKEAAHILANSNDNSSPYWGLLSLLNMYIDVTKDRPKKNTKQHTKTKI